MTAHHHPWRHYLPMVFWDICILWWAACLLLIVKSCF